MAADDGSNGCRWLADQSPTTLRSSAIRWSMVGMSHAHAKWNSSKIKRSSLSWFLIWLAISWSMRRSQPLCTGPASFSLHYLIHLLLALSPKQERNTKDCDDSVPTPFSVFAWLPNTGWSWHVIRTYLHWHRVCHRDLKLENWATGPLMSRRI